jgi:hypothetical protein
MRKLPHTAAEDLLEIIMRRYELQLYGHRPRSRDLLDLDNKCQRGLNAVFIDLTTAAHLSKI